MIYLYVDNFRGFKETFIPIADVNFLVGENSTGKTSVMYLFSLLLSNEFWIEQDFNLLGMGLGNYDDIVSVDSENRSYFRVGLVGELTVGKKSKSPEYKALLLTYKEREGIPRLSQYTFNIKEKEITLKSDRRGVLFKSDNLPKVTKIEEFIDKVFKQWIRKHQNGDEGYELLKRFPRLSDPAALIWVPSLLSTKMGIKEDSYDFIRSMPIIVPADMVWFSPIRTQPQRTYDSYTTKFSSDGKHTPYLIKKILSARTKAEREREKKFQQYIKEFGKKSGLFKSIKIREYFRKSKAPPFELDIVLTENPLSIDNVGYGVSQSLPIIVELFARPENTWFAIQQPEIHLHPRAMVAFSDVVYHLSMLENKSFLIETHSDFPIDSYRINLKENKSAQNPISQILFFEHHAKGNVVHIIEIGADGSLPEEQPPAWRDFFIREQMRLLGF